MAKAKPKTSGRKVLLVAALIGVVVLGYVVYKRRQAAAQDQSAADAAQLGATDSLDGLYTGSPYDSSGSLAGSGVSLGSSVQPTTSTPTGGNQLGPGGPGDLGNPGTTIGAGGGTTVTQGPNPPRGPNVHPPSGGQYSK